MPPRVLHVIDNLDRGAVETWLVRMLEHAQKRGVPTDWTFYCTLDVPGALDDAVRQFGGRIVVSPFPLDRQLGFARALRRELQLGGYDVLHCHHDLVSGLYLAAAAGLSLRRRIVHIHNADENVLTGNPYKKPIYRSLLRRVCLRQADRIIGISNHTLDTFLAGRSRSSERDQVHYYGIASSPLDKPAPDREAFRRRLNVPEDALIVLFAGRIVPEKNPVFTIDVLSRLLAREPRAVAVFAGSGSLESAVVERAGALGVRERVRMLGWCSDVHEIMRCADWFILARPEHPMEGFGIAVVEAQLAGLRLLLSHGIADDPLLPTACFRRLSLKDSPDLWADAAVELWKAPAPSKEAALQALRASPMDMDAALEDMMRLHG